MTQAHLIEIIILGIVLIALWWVSKTTSDSIECLEDELEDLNGDVYYLYTRLGKEPSFKSKIKKEEQRMKKNAEFKLEQYNIEGKPLRPKKITKVVKKGARK